MPFLGPWEIGLILVIIVILFGGKKLPELARSIGKSVREYRKSTEESLDEEQTESKDEVTEQEKKTILETAKKLKIDVEGRSVKEISEEILEKVNKTEQK
jgi:sec-independent protein translocase protein TatA